MKNKKKFLTGFVIFCDFCDWESTKKFRKNPLLCGWTDGWTDGQMTERWSKGTFDFPHFQVISKYGNLRSITYMENG